MIKIQERFPKLKDVLSDSKATLDWLLIIIKKEGAWGSEEENDKLAEEEYRKELSKYSFEDPMPGGKAINIYDLLRPSGLETLSDIWKRRKEIETYLKNKWRNEQLEVINLELKLSQLGLYDFVEPDDNDVTYWGTKASQVLTVGNKIKVGDQNQIRIHARRGKTFSPDEINWPKIDEWRQIALKMAGALGAKITIDVLKRVVSDVDFYPQKEDELLNRTEVKEGLDPEDYPSSSHNLGEPLDFLIKDDQDFLMNEAMSEIGQYGPKTLSTTLVGSADVDEAKHAELKEDGAIIELETQKRKETTWKNMYNLFQKCIEDIENCIEKKDPSLDDDLTDMAITPLDLPWSDGFAACVLLRLESNNVIRNVDDKGTNRRKTSKIGFYNISKGGEWAPRGESLPGMSAVEMFNATKDLGNKKSGIIKRFKTWWKGRSASVMPTGITKKNDVASAEALFEDYRNAKFVGDLTQQAMANEFSYKCWTGDLVACSCVRFIKPKNGEPFLLFYRGRSSQSPEAIFLHFAKTHKPTQCMSHLVMT